MGDAQSPALFVRNATGLVRGWRNRDAFIYHYMVMSLIIAMYGTFTFASFVTRGGSWFAALLVFGLLVIVLCVTYAGLVVAVPRAGGDYVWQSRILGGAIAFVFTATGWWFILWHWAPIYAQILGIEVLAPLALTFDRPGWAQVIQSNNGIFVLTLGTAFIAAVFVSLGIETYSKIQRWSFYLGMLGLALVFVILALASKSDFVRTFDMQALRLFGDSEAYAKTLSAARTAGVSPILHQPLAAAVRDTILLLPYIAFFLLWPNWAAPLYGEVRGTGEFRRVFAGMAGAVLLSVGVTITFLALVRKTAGTEFYFSALAAWANGLSDAPSAITSVWPYAPLWAGWLSGSRMITLLIVILMGFWWIGWVGSLFLSSTRMIFAAAFDRVLPEWAAYVSPRRHVPVGALMLMLVPSTVIGGLYAYSAAFRTYILDSVLVIAVTYLVTSIAALVLPWRRRELFEASPVARWPRIFGIPGISVAAGITIAFLAALLWFWLKYDGYFVNNPTSLVYMASLYVLAIVIYAIAAAVRRRQGVDLKLVHAEIPVE